jgi:hypothetical protein
VKDFWKQREGSCLSFGLTEGRGRLRIRAKVLTGTIVDKKFSETSKFLARLSAPSDSISNPARMSDAVSKNGCAVGHQITGSFQ